MHDSKTCKICGKTFTRRNYMLKHMENIHSKRYTCPICFRLFPGPMEHSCAVKDGRFVCYVEKCSLKFASGMSLRLHVRDAHKKVEENGANLKTKKGARDLVKTLCKSINLLTVCFDELKYQVETMAEFMKSLGYEAQRTTISTSKRKQISSTKEEDYENIDEYIEFIEEELIEEVSEEEEMVISNCEEYIEQTRAEEEMNNDSVILYPKTNTEAHFLSTNSYQKNTVVGKNRVATSTSTLSLALNENEKLEDFPTVTKVGSTIIRQLPVKIVRFQDKNMIPISEPELISNRKLTNTRFTPADTQTSISEQTTPTPPLFLKINYDTDTEVCETDPKITFHFDTRPPDDDRDKYIAPS